MKTLFKKLSLFTVACCLFMTLSSTLAFATDDSDLDGLTSDQNVQSQESTSQSQDTGDNYNSGLTNYLKDYTPVTDENIQSASTIASPIVNVIGNVIGFLTLVTAALIMLVTALDLLYIGVPFTRPHLNPNYAMAGGQGGLGMSPMGGMGGYGGYGGMRGGMMGGMGAMGGGAQDATPKHCWVSDEAVACTAHLAGQQGGMSPMGGMGAMGGMGMMGGMQPQQQQMTTKSCIIMYFKKRVIFIVIFTVALIMLTSSVFTDCGINLAQLLFKIMTRVNSALGNVSI